ncbi:MAG: spiro-SPASM protein [Treponema sp.]|nr:spiro-SPASM protein [Treponema sp.]
MKNIVVFNAVNLSKYAFEKLFDSKCAVKMSFEWAKSLFFCSEIVYFCDEKTETLLKNESFNDIEFRDLKFITDKFENWNIEKLFLELKSVSEGFDNIIYAFADSPFYDKNLTEELYKMHTKYYSEYCFADGYPAGIVPEIFCRDLPNILFSVCSDKNIYDKLLTRQAIFETLKTDINSFDIETLISDHDYRYLRFNFACNSKHNALLCKRAFDEYKKNAQEINPIEICKIAEKSERCLRILPAYYNIQIIGKNRKTIYLPETSSQLSNIKMSLKDFKTLIEKIADYSQEAVINISYMCEATEHEEFVDFVKTVLAKPHLSVLIETSGKNITDKMVSEIAQAVNNLTNSTDLKNISMEKIYWLVCLDAVSEQMYKKVNCDETQMTLAKATEAYEVLKKHFGNKVYPQFMRMNENEEELESFYRYWKSQNDGNLIVQKYDNYCGLLPNRKVADLSPIVRNPCWQLRREMHILANGKVTKCKECVESEIIGDAFSENLNDIFEKNIFFDVKENERCRNCDEYYTFNF